MASGVKRTPSVKVQNDVLVPQRLLSVSRRGGNERPLPSNPPRVRHQRQLSRTQNGAGPSRYFYHENENENEDNDGPIQPFPEVANKRRSFVFPLGPDTQTSWQNIRAAGRPRKTSDPITLQDRRSVHQSVCLDIPAGKDHNAGIVTDEEVHNPFSDAHAARHVSQRSFPLVCKRLSDTTTSSSSSSTTDDDDDAWEHNRPDSETVPRRNGTVRRVVDAVVPDRVQETARNVISRARRSSMTDVYEKAKTRGVELQRKRWVEILFEYTIYTLLLCFIYFVLIGLPLWNGAVYWLYWVVSTKFAITGGWSITIGVAVFYAFGPLLILFEKEPPIIEHPDGFDRKSLPGVENTALLIPCYKSANIVGATIEAALQVFPPSHIFVIANGNSPTPLDNTEEVCLPYGVNHIWSPVGSKIVAQFVGCYAAKGFKNVLLIDDDCALPPNFPVVSDRLSDTVRSIGYTIKSVGPNSSKGTWCQQAQDLEYKISGLQRALAGKMGSATFPHGAISLWDRQFLIQTFHDHPGFSVSEDWFFGHSCRRLGGRIKMCTSVFVETETPPAIFFSSGGSRGGFGEMTVFKQRFSRWNFFFVNGMYYNMHYILTSWKLGWWEIGAKIFVFQEVYETLLYLFTPFILPISFIVAPSFCGYLLAGTVVMYLVNVVIFNEVHLRLRKERIGWDVLLVYYMPYKLILTLVNVASCYWSLYKYARYFAKRHPKVIEDEKAVEVVLRLEETTPLAVDEYSTIYEDEEAHGVRRLSSAVMGPRAGSRLSKRMSARFSYMSMGDSEDGRGGRGGNNNNNNNNNNRRHSFVSGSGDVISVHDGSQIFAGCNFAIPPTSASPGSGRRGSYGPSSPTSAFGPRQKASYDQIMAISGSPGARGSYGSPTLGFDRARSTSPYGWSSPGSDGGGGGGYRDRDGHDMQLPQMVHIPQERAVEFGGGLNEKTGSYSDRRRKNSWVHNMV
ncbi:hypothetical protein VP1G_04025 [Cytospora mali]|uniref:Uncharacterized protein n=1 Tax=Cytospora mali TaxID=578113 RepID=A0A194UYE3_CYTMA|nr:hypothetical protein VP1G_04025 [Valsa mali var. pyri (nom. inval.)]